VLKMASDAKAAPRRVGVAAESVCREVVRLVQPAGAPSEPATP